MYEVLISHLRECANLDPSNNTYAEAADAIEELNRYVQQMEKLRKEGWYLQKTKMSAYGQAIMTMPLPEPPKEET